MASGSRIPSGISLMYIFPIFFSFSPYTARSRSFYMCLKLQEEELRFLLYVPVEG